MQDADKTRAQLIDELAQMRQRVSEAEEALRRCTTELRQSHQGFQTFVYIISHDLRTPLINLKGFAVELRYALETARSALGTALSHLDEKQRLAVTTSLEKDIPEALGFIEFSVARIDGFVNAILKLSRLSRVALKFEPIAVEPLVQEALKPLSEQIGQHGARVTVDPLPPVVADCASMEEILGQILKNAVIYLDSNRPGEIEVTGECSANETVFHIRDNGRGITEEDMHKVFEPFRRAGKQDVPGDGMGLTYVQTLVRRHDGRVCCASEPGVGTTFTFTISNRLEKGDDHA